MDGVGLAFGRLFFLLARWAILNPQDAHAWHGFGFPRALVFSE
jgi:hypothetical protein